MILLLSSKVSDSIYKFCSVKSSDFRLKQMVSFSLQYVPDSDKKRMADSREDVVENGDASLGS